MVSLFWSIVMIVLIMYMFGLMFVQRITGYFQDQGDDVIPRVRDSLDDHFGSVQRTMLTLWEGMSGGDPWVAYQTLIPTGPETCTLFLFFVAFTQIALINILTGLFVENAMKLAEPDRQALYAERARARHQQIRELEKIVKDIDTSGSGRIGNEDFKRAMRDPRGKLRTYLGANGIHDRDAARFYRMLQSADFSKSVDIDHFVQGCMSLEGAAQSLDLQAVMVELKHLHRKVDELYRQVALTEEAAALSQRGGTPGRVPSGITLLA
jgi:hypothetical protein